MMNNLSQIVNNDNPGAGFGALVDFLPIAVVCLDLNGALRYYNSAFLRLFRLNGGSIIGKKPDEVFSSEIAELVWLRNSEVIDNKTDIHFELTFKIGDNDVHDLLLHKFMLRDEQGNAMWVATSLMDISERRRAERQLKKAEEEKLIAYTLLQKIRAGIVIVDQDLKILDSNIGFARMTGEDNVELFETIPGLKGADLEMLVPEVISKMFKAIIETGEGRLERDIKYQNKLYSIAVMTIQKHKIAGAIIRDMSAPMLERAEIIERARQVNRKNMKTVQQIAFLLGENAAQTEELLNSIIESQKYDVGENK